MTILIITEESMKRSGNVGAVEKAIIFILALALGFCLCACNGGNDAESSSYAESSEPEKEALLTVESATSLIKNDKLLTDIFVNNMLCDTIGFTEELTILPSRNNYSDYSLIEELIADTYSASGEYASTLTSYPAGHTPAVTGIEGRTYVFNHLGSKYDDFVSDSDITVKVTDDENICQIVGKTKSGKEISFTAVRENEKWLLEKGIFGINPDESEFDKTFANSQLGSFMSYSGNILVIQLFVSDKESSFTKEDEAAFHEKLEYAFGYISEESEKFGNEVNITYGSAYFEHENVLGTRGLDFDIVFAETGFGSLQSFAEANFDLTGYDNYVFAVCLNKELEISYELYDGSKETRLYFAERVIMGNNTDEPSICVSMLKLLGAYAYDEEVCDKETEALFREYFPNDIMVSESLSFSEMSPVTAYACGITDKLPTLYRIFYYN